MHQRTQDMPAPDPNHESPWDLNRPFNIDQYWRFHDGPCWRWMQAERLAERPVPPTKIKRDSLVWAAAEYLGGHVPDAARRHLDSRPVEIGPAAEITRDHDLSLNVQARLLAGQTPEQIDAVLGLASGVTELYSDLFFDVRDCLSARSWIRIKVFGAEDITPLRKAMLRDAYFGGERQVERWLSHLPHLNPSPDLAAEIEHDLTTPEGLERETLELELLMTAGQFKWNRHKLAALPHGFPACPAEALDISGDAVLGDLRRDAELLLAQLLLERHQQVSQTETAGKRIVPFVDDHSARGHVA